MLFLETDRLILRNFHPEDAPALREIILGYQASEVAVYDHKWPTSAEEIKGVAEWFASADHFLAVCLRESGDLIGFVSLNPAGEGEQGQYGLGYVFNFDFHGRGYAVEACRKRIDHAFEHFGAETITASTAAANLPSCRLLERLGFKRTSEAEASFWEDDDGKPIVFRGYTYSLERKAWS